MMIRKVGSENGDTLVNRQAGHLSFRKPHIDPFLCRYFEFDSATSCKIDDFPTTYRRNTDLL